MRTVLISGDAPVPAALRQLIERGSTVVEERAARELSGEWRSEVDRLVFWAAAPDPAMTRLANVTARREASAHREVIVFVAGEPAAADGVHVSPAELYVWPRDEDRLKLAFLTGA
jgi:hypothetical protein